jgi:hypothetical protein
MKRFLIALSAAACVLAGFSSTAMAGYCDDIDNDGVTYDFCEDISTNNLVDTSDPAAVRDMYNISSTYDSSTNTLYVTTDFDDPASRFLPVHPNGGSWDSLQELNDYLTILLGADELDMIVDICNPSLRISITHTFRSYRWNPNTGELRDSITIIEDAITGWNSELIVDGADLSDFAIVFNCAQGSDGDLSSEQCSSAGERLRQEGDQVCGEYPEPPVLDHYVKTREFDIEWGGQTNGADADGSDDGAHHTGADRIRITNDYYDGNNNKIGSEARPNTPNATENYVEYHEVDEYGPEAVCGFGSTEREENEVILTTSANFPTNECEPNPYNL